MHKDKLYFQCKSHFMAIGYWFICISDGSSMTLSREQKLIAFIKWSRKEFLVPHHFPLIHSLFAQNKINDLQELNLMNFTRTFAHTLFRSRQIHGNLINFNGAHTGAMCFCFPCHIKRLFSPFCFSFLIYFVFVTRVLLLRTLFGSFARPFVYFWFSFIHVSFNSIENIHRLCLVCVHCACNNNNERSHSVWYVDVLLDKQFSVVRYIHWIHIQDAIKKLNT